MQHSLGLMEVTGLSLAITVADVMAKTASVALLGVERTIGSGWMLVKIRGDVASVRTALAAGEETARRCSGFIACTAIARPAKGTDAMASTACRQAGGIEGDIAPTPAAPAKTAESDGDSGQVPGDAPVAATAALTDEKDPAPVPTAGDSLADAPVAATAALTDEKDPAPVPAAGDSLADAPVAATAALNAGKDPVPVPAGKRIAPAGALTRESGRTTAASGSPQMTCKICGDPLCGRRKGEPRSKCIHYQKPVLR